MIVKSEAGLKQVESEVLAGAKWLDEHHPGWVERIDLERLRLSSQRDCIVCQVAGDVFGLALYDLGLYSPGLFRQSQAQSLGFMVANWVSDEETWDWYEVAETIWRREIAARVERNAELRKALDRSFEKNEQAYRYLARDTQEEK